MHKVSDEMNNRNYRNLARFWDDKNFTSDIFHFHYSVKPNTALIRTHAFYYHEKCTHHTVLDKCKEMNSSGVAIFSPTFFFLLIKYNSPTVCNH